MFVEIFTMMKILSHKSCFAFRLALSVLFVCIIVSCRNDSADNVGFSESVFVDGQQQHVQGIAYDEEMDCMYMSFTSRFVKVDMQGNILASIDRIQGHLGAMTFNPQNRKVYASLECKDDEIGQGIARKLNVKGVSRSDTRFYIAVIDVDRLDSLGVDPEGSDILKTACIKKAIEDYCAPDHRYGCSGIDGVAIAPEFSSKSSGKRSARGEKMYLYVGYGIYGDVDREDNDYQVIQRYNLKEIERTAKPVVFGQTHASGPGKPDKEYFVYTGNTNYGIQNLAWDPYTNCMFMAVYKGSKSGFPNYSLFAVPMSQKPFREPLKGGNDKHKYLQLSLVEPSESISPLRDEATGLTGWKFKYGSMGLCPIGDGLWYIAENGKNKETGTHSCNARLYKWNGLEDGPFIPLKK